MGDRDIPVTALEASVIAALQELASSWPGSLTLLSKDSGLCVVHSGDYQAGRVEGHEGPGYVLAEISGIPNDGGGW
jgi:hypothetical protein